MTLSSLIRPRGAMLGIAVAAILVAQPAWAHHKPAHPDFPRTPAAERTVGDPCAMSNNPHQPPGVQAMADRCRRLHAQVRATPDNAALRERCNRAAQAQSAQRC